MRDLCGCDAVADGCGALEKEEEFVQRCMDSLVNASSELEKVSLQLQL